jgi:coenzyme F420-reducing hydrogenase delta subunit
MKIRALGCERSGFPALLKAKKEGMLSVGDCLEVFSLPCLGVVSEAMLFELLKEGDLLLVVGCPPGSCYNEWGSTLAEKKIRRAQNLLDEAGVKRKILLAFATEEKVGEVAKVLQDVRVSP